MLSKKIVKVWYVQKLDMTLSMEWHFLKHDAPPTRVRVCPAPGSRGHGDPKWCWDSVLEWVGNKLQRVRGIPLRLDSVYALAEAGYDVQETICFYKAHIEECETTWGDE